METRVLIVGAAGVLGQAATFHLLKHNFFVRALVRDKTKAGNLEKAGAQVFVGDLTNSSSIIQACKGIDVILTAAHGMIGKGKNRSKLVDDIGHRNLVTIAKDAGVKHFIYTSLNGSSHNHPIDFYRTKYSIELFIKKCGINYTILSLPAFMEWHVHNLLGKSIQEKGRAIILGPGTNPTNFISVGIPG